jgi:hypothetical protein
LSLLVCLLVLAEAVLDAGSAPSVVLRPVTLAVTTLLALQGR